MGILVREVFLYLLPVLLQDNCDRKSAEGPSEFLH
jgi:hypothetical protein